MSILDVTEDQIFKTLGKGRDPNFKPIEKVRPVIAKEKKTCSINQPVKPVQTVKTTKIQPVLAVQAVSAVVEPVKSIQPEIAEDAVKKLTSDLNELNSRVNGIQRMVKWYMVPQFVVVLVLLAAFLLKS